MPQTVGNDENHIVYSHNKESWKNKLKKLLIESESFESNDYRYSILQHTINNFSLGLQVEKFHEFMINSLGCPKKKNH